MLSQDTHDGSLLAELDRLRRSVLDLKERLQETERVEEQLRLVVDLAPDGVVLIDEDGRIGLVNILAEQLFGYQRAELLGKPFELLVPAQLHGKSLVWPGDCTVERIAVLGRRKDGTLVPLEIDLAAFQTSHGPLIRASLRTVGERARAETLASSPVEELRVSDGRVREDDALIGSINDRLTQINAGEAAEELVDGILRNLLELTGSESGFIVKIRYADHGQPALMVLASTPIAGTRPPQPTDLPPFPDELSFPCLSSLCGAVMASGAPVVVNEPQCQAALNAFLGLPLHAHGELAGIIGLANAPGGYCDETITYLGPFLNVCATMIVTLRNARRQRETTEDLRQLTKRLENRTAELEASNKELEAFSYSISHDLRAPLRAIDGFSRILLNEYAQALPSEGVDYLRDIRNNTQYMGQLVDDLLAFSRLNRQSVKREPVPTSRLVRHCIDDLRSEHADRCVEFRVADMPDCWADPTLLKQVWLNLLANALKFTAKRAVATIEVGCRGDRVYFVKDNGVGFDMRYAHKLFGVFQRLHRAEDYEGTGVGLAIVHRIVERHGGRVWADAQLDVGATFCFTIEGGGCVHE